MSNFNSNHPQGKVSFSLNYKSRIFLKDKGNISVFEIISENKKINGIEIYQLDSNKKYFLLSSTGETVYYDYVKNLLNAHQKTFPKESEANVKIDTKNLFRFTLKERRIIMILMLVNSIALFVNYFGLSPKFKSDYKDDYYFCVFTNSIRSQYPISEYGTNLRSFNEHLIQDNFYPFVNFYSSWYDGYYFNGLFPYFDYTEFLVYSLLIFGYFILKKLM